jgi:hypothetical protein
LTNRTDNENKINDENRINKETRIGNMRLYRTMRSPTLKLFFNNIPSSTNLSIRPLAFIMSNNNNGKGKVPDPSPQPAPFVFGSTNVAASTMFDFSSPSTSGTTTLPPTVPDVATSTMFDFSSPPPPAPRLFHPQFPTSQAPPLPPVRRSFKRN